MFHRTGDSRRFGGVLERCQKICILTANVNSLSINCGERVRKLAQQISTQNNPHCVCVQETKLDDSIDDRLLVINGLLFPRQKFCAGYALYRCDRNRQGGGVALYVRRDGIEVDGWMSSNNPLFKSQLKRFAGVDYKLQHQRWSPELFRRACAALPHF